MIDCTKTINYLAEKTRMTKKDKLGRCRLYCGECPLSNKNNGTSENLLCGAFQAIYPDEYKERFSQGNGYYFYGKNRRFNARATQSTIINTHATVIGNIYDNPELLK